jgi:hypothetical protein
MAALDTLIEHSLPLVCASHLLGHVVHLLAVALGTVLLHDDLLDLRRLPLLCCLHPLLPLIQDLLIHNFISKEI